MVLLDRLRVALGLRTSEARGDAGHIEGSASLQEARAAGGFAGSGESRADWFEPDQGVAQMRAILPVENPQNVAGDLAPLARNNGRPQRHIIAMPEPVAEYAEGPALNGHHAEIINRPYVVTTAMPTMLPWEASPPTQWRDVPQTDASNPAPSNCDG